MAGTRNPWEENYGANDGQDTGAKPWEQAYQQPDAPKSRTLGAVANDTVIEVANAAAGGVSAAANFVKPGNAVSGWIDKNIVKAGEDSQSDVTKAAKQQFRDEVENADGVMGELGAVGKYVVQNPLLSAAQAAGSFVGPGLAVKAAGFAGKAAQLGAKGVERAGRAGGVAAGAAMAGGDAAGTAYELSKNAGATEDQAVDAGRQASVIPAIVGGVSGMFGAERLLAGAKGFAGGAASRALKTGASEAAQEGFEEGVTQYEGQRAAMPYDASIDPSKGVAAAAGMGAALGGITGAGTSLLVGRGPQPGGQEPAPDQPPAQPPAPTPGTGPTLALPAPDRGVIQVAGDGTARTPAYQAPGYVGDVADVEAKTPRAQAADFASILDTDSVYSGWSNVQDGSDRATMRDQMDYVGRTYGGKTTPENASEVAADLSKQFKWFRAASPEQKRAAINALMVPAAPIDPVREQVAAAAEQGGALSSAALTAIDTGVTQAMQPAPEQAPPQISLEEADARDRAAYEQFFASHDSDPVVSRYFENDDDIPDFDAASNASEEDFLRALGATDEDIQDAIATSSQSAIPQSSVASNAGPQANEPAGPREGAGEGAARQTGQVNAGAIQQAAPDAAVPGVGGAVGADGAGSAAAAVSGASGPGGAGTGAATGSGAGATEVGSARAGGRGDSNQALSAPTNLRDALVRVRQQKQEAANAQAAQTPAPAAAPVPGPAAAPAVEAAGPALNIKAITAKQIPDMTDAELQAAIEHYGPAHKRTAKLQKEAQRRAAPSAITPTTTQGNADGPQASQAQQASPQPTQAAAAPAAAAGLTDGAPTANTGAQAAPAAGAQTATEGETREQRTQRVAAAGEAWTRMPTVEREAMAGRADGLNPMQRKNVPRAAWADLSSDIQRKLADVMGTSVNTAQGAIKTEANQVAELSLDDQLKQVNDELANQGAVQNARTRAKRDQIRTAIAERDFPAILKAVDGDVGSAEAINQALQFAGDEPKAKVIERVLKNRGVSDEYRQRWAERLMDGQVDELDAEMQSYESKTTVSLRGKAAGDMLGMGNGTLYRIAGIDIAANRIRLVRNPDQLSERTVLVDQDGYNRLLADHEQTRAEAMTRVAAPAPESLPANLSVKQEPARDQSGNVIQREKLEGGDRYKKSPRYPNEPESHATARADVVDYMNGDIDRPTLMQRLEAANLPEGVIYSITQRMGEDGPSIGEVNAMMARRKAAEAKPEVETNGGDKKPAATSANSSPDDWRNTLMKTRAHAKALIDAGKLDAQAAQAVWADHEKLLALVDGGAQSKQEAQAPKAKPAAKKPSADQTRAKADLMAALADLGDILGKNTRMNIMPEQEQKLLPVLTRLLDAAFRLGYHKFKDSAKFALDQIRANLGDDAADALTLDHLQGAYIAMAGGKQNADTKRAVIDVETKADIEAHEAVSVDDEETADTETAEDNQEQSDAGTAIRGNGTEPLGEVAAQDDRGTAPGGDAEPRGSAGEQTGGQPGGQSDGGGNAEARSGGNGAPGPDSAETGARTRGGRSRVSGKSTAKPRRSAKPTAQELRDEATEEIKQASPVNVPGIDFTITDEVELGKGSESVKFADNLAAIRTLKLIEQENRRATPEEQRTLARYVGWGGLKNAFRVAGAKDTEGVAKGWETRVAEVEALLTPAELRAARNSTTAAHYTSQSVVQAVWKAVERLGFRGGAVLEPSVGTGNFLGLMPDTLRGASKTLAVEYDSITARIAQQLYPNQSILHSGFQDVPLPDNKFALAIGNPPFGREGLYFRHNPAINGKSIHNQFFLQSMQSLEADGLMGMVVSHYLMDAMDYSARLDMAVQAEFLGAVRLPDTAFKENARTEVVTDIVLFRKRSATERDYADKAAQLLRSGGMRRAEILDGYSTEAVAQVDAILGEMNRWVPSSKQENFAGSGEAINVNPYFLSNPGQVVGTMDASGTMNGRAGLNVKLADPDTFVQRLNQAIENLPTRDPVDAVAQRTMEQFELMATGMRLAVNRAEPGAVTRTAEGQLKVVVEMDDPAQSRKTILNEIVLTAETPFSEEYTLRTDGKWQREEDVIGADGKPVKKTKKDGSPSNLNEKKIAVYDSLSTIPDKDKWGKERIAVITDMLPVRDAIKRQLVLESSDAPAAMIEANRKRLNDAYAGFKEKHGELHKASTIKVAMTMPDGALALAVEEVAKDGTISLTAIMQRRVTVPPKPVESVKSAGEAVAVVLAESGQIDIERVAKLLGTDTAGAEAALSEGDNPRAFFDPETGNWEPADGYLSGLVRRKLLAAKASGLEKNVAALEKVQPEQWDATQITPNLGSAWIPGEVYAAFLKHLGFSTSSVTYSKATNTFSVVVKGSAKPEWTPSQSALPTSEIVERTLNSKPVKVTYKDSDGKTHVDEEGTLESQMKATEIANEFLDWAFSDDARRDQLVEIFNEKFNTRVVRQRDGSHLTLPGKVPDTVVKMRPWQLNAVWRGITDRAVLYDHAVGAGKTYTAIARAMERRRMGLSKKPMIVVPNHLVEQWAADVKKLYPGANVLAAGKEDFEKLRRRRLFARIGSGDYDMVIVGHSSFGFIDIDPATEQRYLDEELRIAYEAVKEAEEAAAESGFSGWGKPMGVADAERLVKKLEERLAKVRDSKRDRLLTFEEMGIDDLTIDEAHEFKNLAYSSNLQGTAGMGNKAGSAKAMDVNLKLRSLNERPGTSVAFLTGTPISNSVAEMYLVLKNLVPNELRDLGMENFDAWRTTFVSASSAYEPTESGSLKEVTRLGREWMNMKSLMDLYYSVADAVTLQDMKDDFARVNPGKSFPVPKVRSQIAGDGDRAMVAVKPNAAQRAILRDIVGGFEGLQGIKNLKERNAERLRLMDRARKVSLDARAVDPNASVPDGTGKIGAVVDNVFATYEKWADDLGTQIIFLDRSVPKTKGDDKVIAAYDKLVADMAKATDKGDEKEIAKITEKLEAYNPREIEELRNAQNGGWNAYDDIKRQLVAKGIPANEIRFVQEANTDKQKADLFAKVKSGEVRVLIGSTPRMGAGTNVQDRLVALHHVDVTWKPSDIEQREGRIVRQGNLLLNKYGEDFTVDVIAYATEMTVDAKMWSLNATKLKAINGIRKYDGSFQMEFDDEESASMAEMAALATGNPLMVERVTLDGDIKKLEMAQRSFNRRQNGVRGQISQAERAIKQGPAQAKRLRAFAQEMDEKLAAVRERSKARRVTINGQEFTSAEDAELAAIQSIEQQQEQSDGGKGRYVVEVNGEKATSRDRISTLIRESVGDPNFEAEINGVKVIDHSSAVRAIMELHGPASSRGREFTLDGISINGMKVELDVAPSRWKPQTDSVLTMVILDREGKPVATREHGYESPVLSSNSMRAGLQKLLKDFAPQLYTGDADQQERITARAERDLPDLKLQAEKTFPQLQELAQKRERLQQVVAELKASSDVARIDDSSDGATNDAPMPTAGAPDVGGAGALYSSADSALPAKPLSLDRVNQLVQEALSGIRGAPPVEVTAHPGDIGLKVPAGSVGYGVTLRSGDIYVFQSAMGSDLDVFKTVFHELFHRGVRVLVPKGQYVQTMLDLAKGDSRIQQLAIEWKNTEMGQKQKDNLRKQGYTGAELTGQYEALAIEEALAAVAEEIKAEGRLGSKPKNMTIRFLANWLAKLADLAGMKKLAAGIRAMTYNEAERFVMSAIDRSGEPVQAGRTDNLSAKQAAPAGDQTQTEAFKRWFGDSKVVDAQGKPLVVYHGSRYNADIKMFSAAKSEQSAAERGIYFTDSVDHADQYASQWGDAGPEDGGSIYPVYLKIENPYVSNALEWNMGTDITPAQARKRGHDGYVIQNHEGGTTYIAFSSEQIKSAIGNNGDFDPANPDIRFRSADMGSRAGMADLASKARDELNKTFGAPGKLSWWHKTVGTMYNLAERSPAFKRVFEAAQGFVDDVSYYATDAAEQAPRLLPKLETWRDIAKRPITAADNAAVAKPVFEGTLVWTRDEAGKPVRVDDLVAAAEKLTAEEKARRLLRQDKISAGMLRAWQGLPLEQYEKLVESRYESQILKAGIVWTPAELKSMFKLTDDQVALYKEFRAATDRSLDTMARSDMLRYGGKDVADLRDMVMDAKDAQDAAQILRDHLQMLAKEDPGRAGELSQLSSGMLDRAAKVQELQEQGYAPLSRFGKYTVDVVDANGERQYFGLFETQREANIMAMKMRKGYGQDAVTQGTLSNEEFKLLAGITPESLELFGNMLGLDSTGDDAQDQAFQEYLRRTKTNRSAMRRLIHRQGIAGYSEDVGRVLASFIYSNARQTSAGLHMGELGEAVTAIPKQQGELKDAAVQLSEYVKNPQEEAQAIRGLLFAQYLGGSIASAVVNMSQPAAVTFPWLSQFGGAKQAAAELGRAAKNLANKAHRYEADLAAALKHAEEEGTVSPQEVHQLMAQARGSGSLRPGDGTRVGEARAAAGNALTRLSLAWGKVFGAAEQVNRRMTYIAAFRIAKAQKMDNPAAFAKKAVIETQFTYSKANKMKWGRGAVGATVMTFKTYSVAYLELLGRMWSQGGPEGKKAVLLALGMLMLMGGAGGLPFAEDAEDLVDGLAQLAGYNFNSKKAKQELLESLFGEAGAGFVERGITGLPGMPLDVSGRLGMGNLLPGTGIFKEKTDYTRDVLEVVGPVGDLAKRAASGARSILAGDVGAGLLQIAPAAVRNAAKGADMAATDMYRDDKGYKVLDTSPAEAAMKAIGFQPASVAKVQEANFINQQAKNFYNMKAQEIRAKWARGIFEKDQGIVAEARADLEEWNRKNPDQRIVVSMPAVLKRVREMSKTKDQRIADTAPRAMRQQMREETEKARAVL